MLPRFICKSSQFHRFRTLISSRFYFVDANPVSREFISLSPRTYVFTPKTSHSAFFSTNGKNGNFGDDSPSSTSDLWKLSSEIDDDIESVFSEESGTLDGIRGRNEEEMKSVGGRKGAVFRGVDQKLGDYEDSDVFGKVEEKVITGGNAWTTARKLEPWTFSSEEKGAGEEDFFDVGVESGEMGLSGLGGDVGSVTSEKSEENKLLESEEKTLTGILKGRSHAVGDLITSSGITDEMLDSLIALKNLENVEGLPPLSEIEDMRYEKNTKRSSRAEIERQKQEEISKARVRQVDEQGRAYGTGKRKCSIARVWITPGEGRFIVNEKQFDVYFPMLDHRAALLRPLSETKTLGMWDINCTVKGGGTSGQVGAIRLGISRALQNWEPGFRPPLKEAGFLTRDSRVVERKKPGKAKARKSFQWVKR